ISTELLTELYSDPATEHLEDTVEHQLMAECAKKVLLSLPKKYQDVTILRVYAEMSYAQIGNALHISENSARVIYYRAKKMMLEAIQNEYNL
ncbi:MAG: sigma-70 family RNA polymerase sigma factor, partial [Oscillospiraceae bacterium]|nr:sigma-70 family RNA polymerase sigma factor [Oscillospiraceae bacterium]